MPPTEYLLRAPLPALSRAAAHSINRSIFSVKRDQIHAIEAEFTSIDDQHIDSFQVHVADLFQDLAAATDDEFLSIPWLHKLLNVLLVSLKGFTALVSDRRRAAGESPADRLLAEFYGRAVKSLDVFNAVRDGIDQLRRCRRQVEIIPAALSSPAITGDGQLRRARRALSELAAMIEEKEAGPPPSLSHHRTRSLGRSRRVSGADVAGHHRSASWSVSRSWSAARQIQAIAAGVSPPKSGEVAATAGMAASVYTMSAVLLVASWALVAALPCQDRRGAGPAGAPLWAPRGYPWARAVGSVQERIAEEWRRRERRNLVGLVGEVGRIERCKSRMLEIMDGGAEGRATAVVLGTMAVEMGEIGMGMKGGLDGLEQLVREVYVSLVKSRKDALEFLDGGSVE